MTYDDFGNHERFNAILDTYQELGAKATFFVPGGYARDKIYLRYYSREIERIVAEGHALGCHGLIHEPLTVYKKDQLSKDIRQWLGLVSSIVPGYEVKYFRFPFGASDQDAREVFAEYGLQSVLWSLESGGTEERTLQNVLDRVSAGDIVLSHTPRFYDAYYSRQIVESLLSSGYSLESVATGLKKEDCPSARLDPQECPNNQS